MILSKGSVGYQIREDNGGRMSFFDIPSIVGYLTREQVDMRKLSFDGSIPQAEIKEIYRRYGENACK